MQRHTLPNKAVLNEVYTLFSIPYLCFVCWTPRRCPWQYKAPWLQRTPQRKERKITFFEGGSHCMYHL